jgi:hypothetical protein
MAEHGLKVQLGTQEPEDLPEPFFTALTAATTSVIRNSFCVTGGQSYTAVTVAVHALNLINNNGRCAVFKTSCLLVSDTSIFYCHKSRFRQ